LHKKDYSVNIGNIWLHFVKGVTTQTEFSFIFMNIFKFLLEECVFILCLENCGCYVWKPR